MWGGAREGCEAELGARAFCLRVCPTDSGSLPSTPSAGSPDPTAQRRPAAGNKAPQRSRADGPQCWAGWLLRCHSASALGAAPRQQPPLGPWMESSPVWSPLGPGCSERAPGRHCPALRREGGRRWRKAGRGELPSLRLGEVTEHIGSSWSSVLITLSQSKHPVPFRTCLHPPQTHMPCRSPAHTSSSEALHWHAGLHLIHLGNGR